MGPRVVKTRPLAALLVVALGLAAPMSHAASAGSAPLDLAGFFAGESVSRGEIRTLYLFREAFTASFTGKASGGDLRLEERFHFSDGERLQRWHLSRSGDSIRGTVETELSTGQMSPAIPVDGQRTKSGTVLEYDGFAPGGGRWRLHFRHVFTANEDGTLSNRVTVSKFAVPLAVSKVTFAKSEKALENHVSDGSTP